MRRLTMPALLLIAAIAGTSPAFAVEPDEILADPALEARAREISRELRCVVCQNQSIDASSAPLAKDLRLLVRERLEAGDGDGEVLDYIVERYGDYVLLKPPVQANTLVLWAAPGLALLLGAGAAGWLLTRRDAKASPPAPLTEEEQQAVARLDQ